MTVSSRTSAGPWEVYDRLVAAAAIDDGVEEVLIGLTWTLCCAGSGVGLAMSPGLASRTLPWPGTLAGRAVGELATWLYDWDPFRATVGMAAVNAAINSASPLQRSAAPIITGGPANLAVFEHFAGRLAGKQVVVIGRYPGLDIYAGRFEFSVLERQPGGQDLPDAASEYLLADADWVFMTAMTLINKTFPRLAELSRDANLVLMGPTVPWLHELADYGVDYLAGVQLTDADSLRQTVAEGGGTRIFEQGVRYCLADLSASSQNLTTTSPPRSIQP